MPGKNTESSSGLSDARRRANKKYQQKFVDLRARVTPEKRDEVQEHAALMNESASAFINRAIDETMERDKKKKKKL